MCSNLKNWSCLDFTFYIIRSYVIYTVINSAHLSMRSSKQFSTVKNRLNFTQCFYYGENIFLLVFLVACMLQSIRIYSHAIVELWWHYNKKDENTLNKYSNRQCGQKKLLFTFFLKLQSQAESGLNLIKLLCEKLCHVSGVRSLNKRL